MAVQVPHMAPQVTATETEMVSAVVTETEDQVPPMALLVLVTVSEETEMETVRNSFEINLILQLFFAKATTEMVMADRALLTVLLVLVTVLVETEMETVSNFFEITCNLQFFFYKGQNGNGNGRPSSSYGAPGAGNGFGGNGKKFF